MVAKIVGGRRQEGGGSFSAVPTQSEVALLIMSSSVSEKQMMTFEDTRMEKKEPGA